MLGLDRAYLGLFLGYVGWDGASLRPILGYVGPIFRDLILVQKRICPSLSSAHVGGLVVGDDCEADI